MANVTLKIEVTDWLLKAAKSNYQLRDQLEKEVGHKLVTEGIKAAK